MWRITTFTGTVLEVHRFINTRSRRFERPVCRERRELWLGTGQDDEYKFVIHTKLMPARKTHCVTLVLVGMTVLGLSNATTGTNANYLREDPPYLTRRLDILIVSPLRAGRYGAWSSQRLAIRAQPSRISIDRNCLPGHRAKTASQNCGRSAQRTADSPSRAAHPLNKQALSAEAGMKSNNPTRARARKPLQAHAKHGLIEQKNIIELALCHVAELIGLAQEIACNMHSGMSPEAVLQVSGRLATLMHCAKKELDDAKQ